MRTHFLKPWPSKKKLPKKTFFPDKKIILSNKSAMFCLWFFLIPRWVQIDALERSIIWEIEVFLNFFSLSYSIRSDCVGGDCNLCVGLASLYLSHILRGWGGRGGGEVEKKMQLKDHLFSIRAWKCQLYNQSHVPTPPKKISVFLFFPKKNSKKNLTIFTDLLHLPFLKRSHTPFPPPPHPQKQMFVSWRRRRFPPSPLPHFFRGKISRFVWFDEEEGEGNTGNNLGVIDWEEEEEMGGVFIIIARSHGR